MFESRCQTGNRAGKPEAEERQHQPHIEIGAEPETGMGEERHERDDADDDVEDAPSREVAETQPRDALAKRQDRRQCGQRQQRVAADLLGEAVEEQSSARLRISMFDAVGTIGKSAVSRAATAARTESAAIAFAAFAGSRGAGAVEQFADVDLAAAADRRSTGIALHVVEVFAPSAIQSPIWPRVTPVQLQTVAARGQSLTLFGSLFGQTRPVEWKRRSCQG